MSVCLCNLSADTILETSAQTGLELEPAEPDLSLFTADSSIVTTSLGHLAGHLAHPIEVLVGNAKNRRQVPGVACRVWNNSLPKGGVLRVDEELYVTSPELTLLQQSNQLHQAELCQMLGRYLGTWTPKDDEPNGQLFRTPLTTFEQLNSFIARVGRLRGTGNLKFAMAYTCEKAASAPEVSLQLALSLPPSLHGMCLPQPVMNYKVDLSSRAQRLYNHKSIRIDLCWPDKGFGIEYLGDEHAATLGGDCSRWLAARYEGYELWYVAKDQLASADQMDYIGREVAKRLGFDVNEALWPSKSELQSLLNTLAHKEHPHPLSYIELHRQEATAQRHLRKALGL